MDKKQQKKDNTFDAPSDEIQAKITELMGLPADEAAPTLSKNQEPDTIKSVKEVAMKNEPEQTTENPEKVDIDNHSAEDVHDQEIDSPETDEAVKEILQNESNELLEKQDENSGNFKIESKPKKGIKKIVALWWGNKLLRNGSLAIIFIAFVAVLALPASRYATLNAIGVRASTSFVVVDKISGRPVKNVEVTLDGNTTKSSQTGEVEINGLKLGKTQLVLQKRSFETYSTEITIGWGSNPLQAPFEVVPTGTTFTFTIKDWLDDEPMNNAEVTDGESIAIADENGVAKLTIEPTDEDLDITVAAEGFRSEKVTIPADSTDAQNVSLVASKPDVFISKRDGKYDLYKRDIDGKNETLLLAATGSETHETYALAHPDNNNVAALVSTREGERNNDGYLMSNLYLIDLNSQKTDKIDGTLSERIRIVGWSGDRIIFVKTVAGPSASFSTRQRVISYDFKKKESKELTSANYFTDVRLIGNKVLYTINNGISGDGESGLSQIDADGNNRKALIGDNIWAVYRISEDKIVVSANYDKWYSVNLKDNRLETLTGAPAQVQDVKYFGHNDKIARVELRDGKTELLVSGEGSDEKLIIRKSGITLPIVWINDNTILFGVVTNDETSRYVVSLATNKESKVGDNTASIYDGVPYY